MERLRIEIGSEPLDLFCGDLTISCTKRLPHREIFQIPLDCGRIAHAALSSHDSRLCLLRERTSNEHIDEPAAVAKWAVPICPVCQRELSFLSSWTYRGLWGYNEVRTYECPEHGPIFVGAQTAASQRPTGRPAKNPDSGDRDSLVPAPRKPAPPLDADAIAIPEPDPN